MKVQKFNQCCQLERYNLIVTAHYCNLNSFTMKSTEPCTSSELLLYRHHRHSGPYFISLLLMNLGIFEANRNIIIPIQQTEIIEKL